VGAVLVASPPQSLSSTASSRVVIRITSLVWWVANASTVANFSLATSCFFVPRVIAAMRLRSGGKSMSRWLLIPSFCGKLLSH
jgi:hypothetical protein